MQEGLEIGKNTTAKINELRRQGASEDIESFGPGKSKKGVSVAGSATGFGTEHLVLSHPYGKGSDS